MKKKIVWSLSILLCVLFLFGCAERRYYKTHHEHSQRYKARHPQKHVDVDINIHRK